MLNRKYLQTPRQRIRSFNAQIDFWKCYGQTRICAQPICTFCQHSKIDDDGMDCHANIQKFNEGDDIHHCRRFKAQKNWRVVIEDLLNEALFDITRDIFGRLTEANAKIQKLELAN